MFDSDQRREAVDRLLAEHRELTARLSDPAVHQDPALARRLNRRFAELGAVVTAHRAWSAAAASPNAMLRNCRTDPSRPPGSPSVRSAARTGPRQPATRRSSSIRFMPPPYTEVARASAVSPSRRKSAITRA